MSLIPHDACRFFMCMLLLVITICKKKINKRNDESIRDLYFPLEYTVHIYAAPYIQTTRDTVDNVLQ